MKGILQRVVICRAFTSKMLEAGWQKAGFMEDGRLKQGDRGWRQFIMSKGTIMQVTGKKNNMDSVDD